MMQGRKTQSYRKRKKYDKVEVKEQSKSVLIGTKTFHGLVFQQSPKIEFIKTSRLKSRCSVIFNIKDRNTVMFDWSVTNEPDDLEELNSFFSQLTPEKSTFVVKKGTGEYLNELRSQDTKTLEKTYTFLKFIDNNKVIAKANSDLDLLDEIFLADYFIKPLQITITETPNTKRTVSRIFNYTKDPNFSTMNMEPGDHIEFVGTGNNDISVTVLKTYNGFKNGKETIDVSTINSDENLVGTPVLVKCYRTKTILTSN